MVIVFKQRGCMAASIWNWERTGYLIFQLAVTSLSDNDIKKHPRVVNLLNKERVGKQICFVRAHSPKKSFREWRQRLLNSPRLFGAWSYNEGFAFLFLGKRPSVLNPNTQRWLPFIFWNRTPSESQLALLFDLEEKEMLWREKKNDPRADVINSSE